ncbi:DNA internalization-related competence protein ComEC/Rec2 [Tissierella sp.]|uniref:DNA internalization-related competence protein ComEC/Rec2 n=1 Tax=Tissierella sp. TaxID=41274 RepID=UPI0028A6B950|nr:DNA internalization-related competence protein ComEC/Rec2 [Tissierella sp.]
MNRPFVFITIPLALGIIISYYLEINKTVSFILIVLTIGIYILNLIMEKSNTILLFSILSLLGVILGSHSLNSSILSTEVDRDIVFNGIVDEIICKDEEQGKYIIKVNKIVDNSIYTRVKEKMVLKVIGDKNIELGDEISFIGKLKIPQKNTNPMLFNYRLNLLSNKIHTIMTIKDYSITEIKKIDKPFRYRIKASFIESIENLFDNNLNEDNSSMMKSIILGESSYLEEENLEKYRNLGLAHILAVSGLHIGIIAGFLNYILSHLGIKRKLNIVITLSIIWIYGYLIGFPPSLLRANIMFSIIFYGESLREPYDSINTLFFAMFILLIANPIWIFNIGFQLSFMAAFSIIYFTPKIQRKLYPYNNKIVYGLSGILGVQIGLLPVQAYYFNKISILSILSNLIIVPMLSLSLILGGIMVCLFYTIPILTSLIGNILNLTLSIQFKLVDILYKIPFGILNLHSPNIFEIFLYYILLLIIFKVIRIDRFSFNIKKSIIYYFVILILFNFLVLLNDKSIDIHFIDVGQGDSALINTKKGSYLIDTGGNIMDSFDIGKNITFPYLQKNGINKLRGVFITHFDDDHCKSLPLLMDNIDISNILISYKDNENPVYNKIKEKDIPLTILKEKDLIWLDENTSIEVLSPNEDLRKAKLSPNNLSLVFLLSYYDKKILFTGDIEKEAEVILANKLKENIDIIKVPHHGSNTSSTEELLNNIRPSIGVISVGRNNFYGHPKEEVLDRYNKLGTRLYRTDTMGLITVKLNKQEIDIRPFIRDKLKLTALLKENLMDIIIYIVYYLITYVLIKIYLHLEEGLAVNEL